MHPKIFIYNSGANRRNPLSVSISGNDHVMRLVRHQRHLLAVEGNADQPGRQPLVHQPCNRAVVVAGAIADAVAARIEGGERHQHHRRIEHLGLFMRPDRAKTHLDHRRAAHQFAKDDGGLVENGRQAKPRPLLAQGEHQRPDVDFRAHRPEAGDDLARLDAEVIARRVGHIERNLHPPEFVERIAAPERFIAEMFFQVFGRGHGARVEKVGFGWRLKNDVFYRMIHRTWILGVE